MPQVLLHNSMVNYKLTYSKSTGGTNTLLAGGGEVGGLEGSDFPLSIWRNGTSGIVAGVSQIPYPNPVSYDGQLFLALPDGNTLGFWVRNPTVPLAPIAFMWSDADNPPSKITVLDPVPNTKYAVYNSALQFEGYVSVKLASGSTDTWLPDSWSLAAGTGSDMGGSAVPPTAPLPKKGSPWTSTVAIAVYVILGLLLFIVLIASATRRRR